MNKNLLLRSSCLTLCLIVLAPVAHAQTPPSASTSSSQYMSASNAFAPISDRIVSDPLFLPLTGQIYGSTAYTFTDATGNRYNASGSSRNSFDSYNNLLTQTLAYGISDEFSLHFSMGYGINTTDTTASANGNVTNGNANGFTNPTFGATYRVFDQARRSPVDVDLTVNYAPDMIDDKTAGGGHEGTIADGRQVGTFIAAVGREMKMFTVEGYGEAQYFGDSHYEALGTDDQFKQDSYMAYTVGVNTQTRLTQRISFNVGANYTLADTSPKTTNQTTGTEYASSGANTFTADAALNYHFIPNRLVGALTYTFNDFADSANDYAASASNVDTRSHYANIYGARLQYLFN